MADTDGTTRAKRKRSQMSYDVDEYFEDLDMEEHAAVDPDFSSAIDESDVEDVDFGTRKKPKKKVKKQPKKKEKRVPPFRFLDLPPELRDEIYDLALVDSEIAIVSTLRKHRRSVERGTITCEIGAWYYGKRKPHPYSPWTSNHRNDREMTVLGRSRKEMIPNILAVNKQIREEASSILYKQEFFFEDMAALHTFVTSIGPYNRRLLSEVVVKGYALSSTFVNYAAFCALADCTNIRSLFFDCDVGYRRKPKWVARQIYRDGRFFLEAYGAVNGAPDAAVDVIELVEGRHFNKRGTYRPNDEDVEIDQKKKDEFYGTLRSLLAPPRPKRKSGKSRA